jgi:hypothetical protein
MTYDQEHSERYFLLRDLRVHERQHYKILVFYGEKFNTKARKTAAIGSIALR